MPSPVSSFVANHVDAQLTIASRSNPKAWNGIDPARKDGKIVVP
jgi:hypothetical protein